MRRLDWSEVAQWFYLSQGYLTSVVSMCSHILWIRQPWLFQAWLYNSSSMFTMPERAGEERRRVGQEGGFKSDSNWLEYGLALIHQCAHTDTHLMGTEPWESHFQPTQSQQRNTVHPLTLSCISPLLQSSLSLPCSFYLQCILKEFRPLLYFMLQLSSK